MTHNRKSSPLQRGMRNVAIGLTAWAILQELRKPQEERTWHGTVAGFVPYDFRMPTIDRIRERMWSPESSHVVSPQVFGVGWTVNAGRVVELARRRFAED